MAERTERKIALWSDSARRIVFGMWQSFLCLLILLLLPSTSYAQIESSYSRINLGGGVTQGEKFGVDDSITLEIGAKVQESGRFRVTSKKTLGNNGIGTAIDGFSIHLEWPPGGSQKTSLRAETDVSLFHIHRSHSAKGPFIVAGVVPGTTNEYTDRGLAPATTYFYQVFADDGQGHSWPWTLVFSASTEDPAQATPTATSTMTFSPSPTLTTTPTSTQTGTVTPTPTLTLTPSPSWTITPSFTPSFTPTATTTETSTETPTPSNTETCTMTPTQTGTPSPTSSPTPDEFSRYDLHENLKIDANDLLLLIGAFRDLEQTTEKANETSYRGDFNLDLEVDYEDLFLFAPMWEYDNGSEEPLE